jgi:hypothetical protein
MNKQDEDVGLTIEHRANSEVGITFTLEAEVSLTSAAVVVAGVNTLSIPMMATRAIARPLIRYGLRKSGRMARSQSITVALSFRNAALLVDLHLIAGGIAEGMSAKRYCFVPRVGCKLMYSELLIIRGDWQTAVSLHRAFGSNDTRSFGARPQGIDAELKQFLVRPALSEIESDL